MSGRKAWARALRGAAAACGALLLLSATAVGSHAADLLPVRVGVLKFGTVNWELDVIARHGFDRSHGVKIVPVELVAKEATAVALQSKAVDIIVTDWLWVSRQRAAGTDYTFVPHSTASGALMVRADSGIKTLADLKGKPIGVAGGPVDKSWLLFRAYMRKTQGFDPAEASKPVFAAPPLLNRELELGKLPAALNFWNYDARLAGTAIKPLITVAAMLPTLGVKSPPPLIGWVFSQGWAERNPNAVRGFLAASHDAKALMASSDDEWRRLRPLTQATSDAMLASLRDGYRGGIIETSAPDQRAAADALFKVLAEIGGPELVGPRSRLSPGTFWAGAGY